MNINIGINLQWNLVNTALLIAFFIDWNRKAKGYKISFQPFYPFLFLFLAQLLEMPFQDGVPFDFSINAFRLDLMSYFILPFVIYNETKIDAKIEPLLRKALILCICIAFGYGLFLTTTNGINPYQIAITAANGVTWNEDYSAVVDGRIFGRISSVFTHPMTYGLFLGLALIYCYTIKESLKKHQSSVILIGIVTAIFLCGIRSPIGALFATVLAFLLLSHKVKLMLQVGVLGCIAYLIISSIPDLSIYVGSIFSDEKSQTSGSSMEMRLEQLQGCFKEIESNPIFGKGYGWVNYYKQAHGDHPVMLAFESLIYVVLCNSGYLGAFVWVLFILFFFRNTQKIIHSKRNLVMPLTLMAYYLSYTVITGEYGYMKFFILFYIMILIYKPKQKCESVKL